MIDPLPNQEKKSETVVIVIPTLNEEENINRVIDSVRCKKFPYEIVVVDGGSTDRTCSVVRVMASVDARIHLICNPKKIQAAGVNLAVAKFAPGHRFFIRADAHCSYPEGWSDKIVEHLIATGASSVVVPMITVGNEPVQEAIAFAQNSKLGNGGAAHRNGQAQSRYVDHGHHAGFLSEFFMENGGYDENFAVNEDGEYDIRTATRGARIWMAADAAIEYFPRKSFNSLARQYFKYGRGRADTVCKHMVLPKIRQMVPAGVTFALLLVPLACIYKIFALPFGMYLIACLVYTLKTALKDNGVLFAFRMFFALAVMHVSWGSGFLSRVLQNSLRSRF